MTQIPFVIFFQGRSGSSLLASLLASHPDILCRKEEFSMANARGFDARGKRKRILAPFFDQPEIVDPTHEQCLERLKKIFAKRPFQATGFKFKFPNQTETYPEVLAELKRCFEELRVIHMTRINQLKRGVSRQHLVQLLTSPSKSRLRGANMKAAPDRPKQKISVNLEQLKSFFKRQERQAKRLNEILVEFPRRHEITYEDLMEDQAKVMSDLFLFLGVDPEIKVTTNLRKLTPDLLVDIVENYEELVAEFKGTEYEDFLDK